MELDSHHDGGRSPISIPLPLVPEPRATPHMFLHGTQNQGSLNMTLPHRGYTLQRMNVTGNLFWLRIRCAVETPSSNRPFCIISSLLPNSRYSPFPGWSLSGCFLFYKSMASDTGTCRHYFFIALVGVCGRWGRVSFSLKERNTEDPSLAKNPSCALCCQEFTLWLAL